MSKYYLLSQERNSLPIYEYVGFEIEKSTDVISIGLADKWLLAQKNAFYRVSDITNIMYLFTSNSSNNSLPLYIYEVEIKNVSSLKKDEVGHHDCVSSFSFYNGYLVNNIKIICSYDLSKKSDLNSLISNGFFKNDAGSLSTGKNLDNYYTWLISCSNYMLFEYVYLKYSGTSVINDIVHYNRVEMMVFIIKHGFDINDAKYTIDYAIEASIRSSQKEMLELLLPYTENKKKHLYDGVIKSIDSSDNELVLYYFNSLVSINADKELLNVISVSAAKEKISILGEAVSKVISLISNNERMGLILQALSIESNDLLEILSCDDDEVSNLSYNFSPVDELKYMVGQGNIIACRALLDNCTEDDLNGSLLIAAEKGYLGIVKLLISHGADASTWMNYPIKYSNKYNYRSMKKYLCNLGVPDLSFH